MENLVYMSYNWLSEIDSLDQEFVGKLTSDVIGK